MGAQRRSGLKDRWFLTVAMLGAAGGGCGDEAKCGDCVDQGYRVDLSNVAVGTKPPPAVLFSGWRTGWCQEDLLCTGNPDVYLGELDPGLLDWTCDEEELVAFSPGHAPTVKPVDHSTTGLSMSLDPAVSVDVTLWIVNSVVSAAEAQFDADHARDVFAELGTGIDLKLHIKKFPPARLAEVGGVAPGGFYQDATCNYASNLSTMADGFDAGRLNVYYVAAFAATEAAPGGLYFGYPPTPRPEVILIDGTWSASPAGLAHELGHAFGLRRSAPLPDDTQESYGHVNELELDRYLSSENLMESGAMVVEQITVGQIYRMHFDNLSWLKHIRTPIAGYPRECQNSAVEGGPCPPLTLQPPRGWP